MTPRVPIETILIPTDGSDGARVGASRGLELAATLDATVHVLAVVDDSWIGDAVGSDSGDRAVGTDRRGEESTESDRPGLIAAAEDAVDAVEELAEEVDPTLAVTTAVGRGSAAEEIVASAVANDVDAIAMGTKGLTGLDRVLLGSVTGKVLRSSPVPVLAVPPGARDASLTADGVADVLLPTDGSEGAGVAVDWGVDFAAAVDATVHALYSAETSRLALASDTEGALSKLEREGEDALETIRQRARDRGCTVTGTVANGPAVDVILTYVDDRDVDLVVMGTHGRSGVGQHLLVSTTENVVRNAAVPIVCVPLPDR